MEFSPELLTNPDVVYMANQNGQTVRQYLSSVTDPQSGYSRAMRNRDGILFPNGMPKYPDQRVEGESYRPPPVLTTPLEGGEYPTFTRDNRIPQGNANDMIAAIDKHVEAGNLRSDTLRFAAAERAMGALSATEGDRPENPSAAAERANGALSATGGDRPEYPNAAPAGANGVLSPTEVDQSGYPNAAPPALQDPNAPSPSAPPILSSGGGGGMGGGGGGMGGGGGSSVSARRPTGNARGSSMPYAKIGMGESLLRMGLAGMAGADQGMGATMGAMGQVYGGIQDSNRATDIKAAEVAEARRIADARVAASRAGGSGGDVDAGGSGSDGGLIYHEATLSAINDIQALIDSDNPLDPFDNVNGWTGNILSAVAGTAAHDVKTSLDTVTAAIGFDRLDAMRKASKTGGALGQITERELDLLKASLGALQQSSSRAQFQRNLTAVKLHYTASVNALRNQQRGYSSTVGGAPQPSDDGDNSAAVQAALDKYK